MGWVIDDRSACRRPSCRSWRPRRSATAGPTSRRRSDEQLVARAFSLQRHLRVQFSSVVWASMGSSVGPAVLPALLGDIEPDAVAKLMAGIGDVDSAGIAGQIFEMSRLVRESEELTSSIRRKPRRPSRALGDVGTPPTSSGSSTRSTTFMYDPRRPWTKRVGRLPAELRDEPDDAAPGDRTGSSVAETTPTPTSPPNARPPSVSD